MRNWRPYIPDVVKQMRADGVEEMAAICLAPQNSRTSVGLYRRAVMAEARELRIDFTDAWARHPLLIEAFAERLRPALRKLTEEVGHPVPVLFTAHSVPVRTVQPPETPESGPKLWPGEGADPYAEEGAPHRGTRSRQRSGDCGVALCVSEPGRERRAVARDRAWKKRWTGWQSGV